MRSLENAAFHVRNRLVVKHARDLASEADSLASLCDRQLDPSQRVIASDFEILENQLRRRMRVLRAALDRHLTSPWSTE